MSASKHRSRHTPCADNAPAAHTECAGYIYQMIRLAEEVCNRGVGADVVILDYQEYRVRLDYLAFDSQMR